MSRRARSRVARSRLGLALRPLARLTLALWLGVAVFAAPVLHAQSPAQEKDAAQLLEDPRYAFCRPDWHVRFGEADLCRFAREPMPACPGFVSACAGTELSPETDRPKPLGPLLGPLGAMLANALFWVLLIGGVLWLAFQILSNLQHDAEPEPGSMPRDPEQLPEEPVAAHRLVDADALRLLNAAREAAAQGDRVRAAELAHAALVRALESGGHVHVDRCRSNGDYARALAGTPELCDVFRAVAREVERSEFGGQSPTAEAVQALFSRVEPIVQRLVAVLLVVGALCATGCGIVGSRGGLSDDGPGGCSLFKQLLEQSGAHVQRRVSPLSELGDHEVELLILEPSAVIQTEEWLYLQSWVSDGGTLLFVGAPAGAPKELGIRSYLPRCTAPAELVTATLLPGGARFVALTHPVELDASWTAHVACTGAALVATRDFDEGRFLLISEEDFLSNAALAAGDHARLLAALLGKPSSVQIVDRVTGGGAESPYRAISNSGLGPLLAHGLAWLVLWALAAGTSFGTARDPVEASRRAFAEHVRAVARSYARAGASRHALSQYAGWALDRLHARLLPGKVQQGVDLASRIAHATGRSEADITRLITEASAARDRPEESNEPARDLDAIARLGDLVRETGGKR